MTDSQPRPAVPAALSRLSLLPCSDSCWPRAPPPLPLDSWLSTPPPHSHAHTHAHALLQPAVYRGVITDVIDNIRPEFDQLGVEEAVLQELLRLWELRLAQSRAADFTQDQRMAPVARQFPVLKHDDRPAQPDEKPVRSPRLAPDRTKSPRLT